MVVVNMTNKLSIGPQMRSFRAQRRQTLDQIAEKIYVERANRDEELDVEVTEQSHKRLINQLSRIERGERGARGLKRELEIDVCTALDCTTKELHEAPFGYHLYRGGIVQCEYSDKHRYESKLISIDLQAIPDEWRKPGMLLETSVVYVPTIFNEEITMLSESERLALIIIAMQYHQPAMVAQLREKGRNAMILHYTKEELNAHATRVIDEIEWDKVYLPGAVLHTYALHWEENGQDHTNTGFAWDQEWFKTATQKEIIGDEVGSSAHPSQYPDPANPKSIPVLGWARGGAYDMEFVDNGNAFERIEAPPFLSNVPEAFSVVVSNDSMEPRYDPGDYLYCHPNKVPRRGDYVVVALTEQRAIVKRFLRQTPESVSLQQLNPEELIEIDRSDVVRIFVIVGTNTP